MQNLHVEAPTKDTVCKHEWLADLSSLFAVILLFSSVFLIMHFHHQTLEWFTSDDISLILASYTLVLLDAVLIVSLLCFGPRCHANNGRCFGTFRGRKR